MNVIHAVKVAPEPVDDGDDSDRFRWECRCGARGAIWWSDPAVAQRAGDRHLFEIERVAS